MDCQSGGARGAKLLLQTPESNRHPLNLTSMPAESWLGWPSELQNQLNTDLFQKLYTRFWKF